MAVGSSLGHPIVVTMMACLPRSLGAPRRLAGVRQYSTDIEKVLDALPRAGFPAEHPLAAMEVVDADDASERRVSAPKSPGGELSPEDKASRARGISQASREKGVVNAVGRRKRAVAQVWITPTFEELSPPRPAGTGREVHMEVNRRHWVDYFQRLDHREQVIRPFDVLEEQAMAGVAVAIDALPSIWSVRAIVHGGGMSGQAGAMKLGLARCLEKWESQWRKPLKRDGLLTRDSREVEMKKYGRKKARRSFQWVKR